jgi:hypothetical protein
MEAFDLLIEQVESITSNPITFAIGFVIGMVFGAKNKGLSQMIIFVVGGILVYKYILPSGSFDIEQAFLRFIP